MFKYGLRLRPCGIGCQPKDFIKFVDSDKHITGYHSFVYYNRQLTEQELKDYEIDFICKE